MNSILITSTPTECRECPCINGTDFGAFCGVTDKELIYDYEISEYTKPPWCPLCSLPEPKDLTQYTTGSTNLDKVIQYAHDQGYNDCLNEIKGANI